MKTILLYAVISLTCGAMWGGVSLLLGASGLLASCLTLALAVFGFLSLNGIRTGARNDHL